MRLSLQKPVRSASWVAATAALLWLSACSATIDIPALPGLTGPEPEAQGPQQFSDQAPWHAEAVVAALVGRMHGIPDADIAGRIAVENSGAAPTEPFFTYDGFALEGVDFASIAVSPDDPSAYEVDGTLLFADATGRRAAARFASTYSVADEAIAFSRVSWAPLFTPAPETEMYVVPGHVLASAKPSVLESHASFHAFVSSQALSHEKVTSSQISADLYAIVVFFKDRISPDAQVAVSLSQEQSSAGGYSEDTVYRAFDPGWPVAMIPGIFALDETDSLWVKVVFVPGSEVPEVERTERVVGRYSIASAE